jgi:glycosyltransferase involved in cell wall biosynthesis
MTAAPPKLRVLIASHGHPKIAKGGAEIAAWQLYQELLHGPDCEAWFLGCEADAQEPHARITQPFTDREYLYSGQGFDWFRFANPDPLFPEAFTALLLQLRPDVINFHHYGRFGVEVFRIARRALPQVRIILTLHEYLAICHHFGQMVTRPHLHLCHSASPHACNRCFPDIERERFFLRKLYLQTYFRDVDHFISPSDFLRDRYIAWGIEPDRISMIENLVAPPRTDLPTTTRQDQLLRVGFFGNISHLKGIDVLLEAARQLELAEITDIIIEIHGEYRLQPPEFQTAFLARLAEAGSNVHHLGPYDEITVDQIMRQVDVVVVPSVWWENSPVVIQEARRNNRPVICSDIGGMAEKVVEGEDGWHFPVGNAQALASLLRRLSNPDNKPSKNNNSIILKNHLDKIRLHLTLFLK